MDETSEAVLLKEISKKLDVLIALSAIQGKSTEDQLKVLVALELSSPQIAAITGLSAGYIRTWKSRHKRAAGR